MIKKRNLDPSLLGWIMNVTGLGPGIGDVHYLCPADSAYYSWLRDDLKQGPSKIHFTLADGEDALVTARNDILVAFPGSYVQSTTALTWDKTRTHLLGVGPLGIMEHAVSFTNGDADAAPTAGNWVFSGDQCLIQNVCFRHRGAATNLVNVSISGDNQTFQNVHFHNMANTATADEATMKGTVLTGCNQAVFKRCVFGGTEIERTDGAADMTIGADTCDNLFFYDCLWIADLDAAADADHAFIETVADPDLAKLAYFENPVFANVGAAASLPDALTVGAALAGEIIMRNPMVVSVTDIADNEEKVWILGPGLDPTEASALAPGKTMGIAVHPDVT